MRDIIENTYVKFGLIAFGFGIVPVYLLMKVSAALQAAATV